ncbi:carbohydrate ABC transporter permease [Devosia sp. MC532]|uniref:carbohydrate ABC transporter permease n=1 Tax=Devosia sp. MC532 TaxID=2799788 RepID=UPI0018F7677A|nr:carbohydrate ABC transporter permease [Devosia sp. MC532]MBJ7577797.1 carbohydrate ABC transporter permease [Devosia sp. MC532]
METNVTTSRMTAIALSFMAVIWVSPFSWLILNAFNPDASGLLEIPKSVGLDNFAEAVSGDAGRQFLNSLIIAAGTATLSVLVGIAAAYPLSRLRIPGRNAFLWTLVLLRMLPSVGVLVPLYFAAQRSGLLNQLGVIISLTILNLPFTLLLLKNFFDTVPIELEEAAYVEGASLLQIVTKIVLPMSRAGIAVVWFYSFTGAWNEFLLPLIFARVQDAFPMSVGLYAAFGQQGAINYGFLTAFSIIYAAPAIGVYFLLRRNMNTGFAGVGVKG